MRKQLLVGALLVSALGVANVHGGIFSRGGGCPNGTCGRSSYSGYYATNVVSQPTVVAATPAQPAAPQQPVAAAQPAAPQTLATPAVTAAPSTRTTNVSTAQRGRIFRRWSR